MNAFPYTSGHLMIAPLRHEGELEDLEADEATAVMAMTQQAVAALKSAYTPDGINVGVNLGRPAGAGVPGHVHLHVLPRWNGDTNFMTSVAETRVLPEDLRTSWEKLRAGARGRRTMSDTMQRGIADELPEDLDVTAYVGPYVFPNINRRRIPAAMYAAARGALPRPAGSGARTRGLLAAAVLLAAICGYHFLAAWDLEVDQTEALVVATRTVGFPVGPRLGAARRGAGCAAARCGASSSTRPTNRRRCAASSSSTPSTVT